MFGRKKNKSKGWSNRGSASRMYSRAFFWLSPMIGAIVGLALAAANLGTAAEQIIITLLIAFFGIQLEMRYDAYKRSELQDALRQVPSLSPALVDIAERIGDLHRQYPDSPLVDESLARLEELFDDIGKLRDGMIVRGATDYQDLISAARAASASIVGVTNITGTGQAGNAAWWLEGPGREYWEANKSALSRDVRVSRVFVHDGAISDELKKVCNDQVEAGVSVWTIAKNKVWDPNLLQNFAVFDDRSAWLSDVNAHGEISANIFHVGSRRVGELRKYYALCKGHAESFRSLGVTPSGAVVGSPNPQQSGQGQSEPAPTG